MADLLIIDDDLDMANLLAELLATSGHGCRLAPNGRVGMALVQERRPDLVLLDVEMPVLSGPETVLALVLRNCGDEKIPILLISGAINLARIAQAVGTPYYLAKPYPLESVLHLVERSLQERIPPRPLAAERQK